MVQLNRKTLSYENCSTRFLISREDFDENCFKRQYFHFYRTRVNLFRQRIIDNAKKLLGEAVNTCHITEAKQNSPVLIMGTIIKRVALRPSILRSLADEEMVLPQPIPAAKLITDDDYIEIEDENQIVRLTGAVDFDDVSTGIVVGLYGKRFGNDAFHVQQFIWPLPAVQPVAPTLDHDKFVMIISGLSFTSENDNCAEEMLALDLLQKWLGGYLPISEKERFVVENLSRLIVAGESIAVTDQGKEFSMAARYLIRNEEAPNVECVAHMDHFLSKISNLIEIDVMPGLGDPATHLQPQQPIHRAVFPHASQHGKMLNLVTNPYHFCLEGTHIIGTSGDNISDLKRFSVNGNSIELLNKLLLWQHLAPTVPDTIDGFPFANRDPFIIEVFPHILFSGNQENVEHSVKQYENGKRTLLVSVPNFAKTNSAVIINLRTLEVTEQNFSYNDFFIS